MTPRSPLLIASLALVLACAGCGVKGPRRVQVAGMVTYKGQPAPAGRIFFEPVSGGHGPQGIADLRDGRYITHPGFGPVPGPTVIRVEFSVSGRGAPAPPADADDQTAPILPFIRFEHQVDIPEAREAQIDIEVPATVRPMH